PYLVAWSGGAPASRRAVARVVSPWRKAWWRGCSWSWSLAVAVDGWECRMVRAVVVCPPAAARWRAVSPPSLVAALAFSFRARSLSAMGWWPCFAAKCKAVQPSGDLSFRPHFSRSTSSSMGRLPLCAAYATGIHESLNFFGFTSRARNICAMTTSPSLTTSRKALAMAVSVKWRNCSPPIRHSTAWPWPLAAATSRGVSPRLLQSSDRAPAASSILQRSASPFRAA
ncbi:hypothetical protein Tdes44962_MAKER10338, partial [Teratosphaeria destructans]